MNVKSATTAMAAAVVATAALATSSAYANQVTAEVRPQVDYNGATIVRDFRHTDYSGHYWWVRATVRLGYVSDRFIRVDSVRFDYWASQPGVVIAGGALNIYSYATDGGRPVSSSADLWNPRYSATGYGPLFYAGHYDENFSNHWFRGGCSNGRVAIGVEKHTGWGSATAQDDRHGGLTLQIDRC